MCDDACRKSKAITQEALLSAHVSFFFVLTTRLDETMLDFFLDILLDPVFCVYIYNSSRAVTTRASATCSASEVRLFAEKKAPKVRVHP